MTNGDFDATLIKAMVVDDHDPIRKAMKRVLSSLGIVQVIECFDGADAIKQFTKNSDINLVLCDIYMRKVDGFGVLSYIRNRSLGSDIPVLVVTGEASKEDIIKASNLGSNDYLIKPFQAEVLAGKVRALMTNFFNPKPFFKFLRDGDRFLLAKDVAKAISCYQKALELEPQNKRACHSYALALFKARKIEEALAILKKNIERFPSYYRNYATLANIYLFRKQTEKAVFALQKELELNPKQAKRQVQLAKILLRKDQVQEAISHFKDALKDNAKDKAALYGMGKALARNQDFEKSLYYFKRMRRYYPKDSKSLEAIFKLCKDFDVFKKVEGILIDEKNLHPERHDTFIFLAKYYIKMDQYDKAKLILSSLIKADEEHQEGLNLLGHIAFVEKNAQTAYKFFEKSLALNVTEETLYYMAKCKVADKKVPEAVQLLQRALFVSPFNLKSLQLLGRLFQQMKEPVKASILYLLAIDSGGDQATLKPLIHQCKTARTAR